MADVASAFFAKLNELVVMHNRAGVVLWGFLVMRLKYSLLRQL